MANLKGNVLELAKKIAKLRNARIKSSESNIQGFSIDINKDNIKSIYHVLMPSTKGVSPEIYVGEIEYDLIDIDNIKICKLTTDDVVRHPLVSKIIRAYERDEAK